MHTYITLEELSLRTTYSKATLSRGHITQNMIEGIHFVRPLGGKKKLYIWDAIERDMLKMSSVKYDGIPMANGGTCHG
jgi:hypothetical protein